MKLNTKKLFALSAMGLLAALAITGCDSNNNASSSNQEESSSISSSIVKKWTVSFDLNGGTTSVPEAFADQQVEEGHWAVKPTIEPTKEHATFKGWYAEGEETKFSWMTQIYGNVRLVAQWQVNEEDKVTLTIDPNGGVYQGSGVKTTVDTFIGDSISLSAPTKDGFVFKGWFYGDGIRFTGYVSSEVAAAGTIRAEWMVQDFNYYFSINDDESVTITGLRDIETVIVTFPSTIDGRPVTKIGHTALQSRIYVQEVTIPASVTEIEDNFSGGARALTAIYVDAGNKNYAAEGGLLYSKDMKTLVRVPPKASRGTAFSLRAGVTHIAPYCFDGQKDEGMTSFNFNEDLVDIGDYAFYDWSTSSSLKFPSTLRRIGKNAFCTFSSNDKVTIQWNEGLERIEEGAFFGVYLNGILSLPEGLKHIGVHAFGVTDGGNAVTKVILPSTLEDFTPGVFTNCHGIDSVQLRDGNTHYKVVDNILYSIDGKTCVWVPSDHKGIINIAEGVTTIAPYACGEIRYYEELILPSTLKRIDDYAFFYNVSLSSITIPDSVEYIGESAFDRCRLSSLSLGNGVKYIGKYAFAEIKISSITIPSSVDTIDDNAFYGVGLRSITFNEGVKKIGKGAFYFIDGSSYDEEYMGTPATGKLESLVLPNSLIELGDSAFAKQTALTSVTFGSGLTKVGSRVFDGAKITSMRVAEGGSMKVKDLALYSDASFTKLIYASSAKNGSFAIPEGCVEVGDYACSGLKVEEITLPSSLKKIGMGSFESTFNYADKIQMVFPSSLEEIGEGAFYNSNLFGLDFTAANKLKVIGDYAFDMINKVESFVAPSSLEKIGDYAFYGADVRSITLNEGLKEIGEYAFFGNRNLTGNLVIPASLESLGEAVIGSWGNTGSGNELTSLSVASGSTHFASENNVVFDSLKSKAYMIAGKASGEITLPSTLKSIGAFGLADAQFVTRFHLPEGLESIGTYAFSDDSSVMVMNIPSSVLRIEERAFWNWKSAQLINVPHSMEWAAIHFDAYWVGGNATVNYNA